MIEKRLLRDDCSWTDERCAQFEKFERLLYAVSMLNHGSNFLGHAQECIDLADELRRWNVDTPSPSFVGFLRDQAIADRFPEEKGAGS